MTNAVDIHLVNKSDSMKVNEVAAELRLPRSRVYEMLGRGELPSYRIGRSIRVSRRALAEHLAATRRGGDAG